MKFLSMAVISAVAVIVATPALAQISITPREGVLRPDAPTQQIRDRQENMRRERNDPRMEEENRRRNRDRQPSAEQVARAAQAAITSANVSCRVTESKFLGKTDANKDLYEVACDGGVGYIVQASTPPETFNCLLLGAQADRVRAEGGEVAEGTTCTLAGNQNGMALLAGYATEAGVPCQIDAGTVAGATADGNVVYEVGCPGADGYHIERTANGWKKTDCLMIMSSNLTCQFTTQEEQVAAFKPLLVGTAIDDCDAQRIHLLGQNDNGRFIEVKCASGDGFVARIKENAVEQVYPCALAIRIGGGCTMTEVATTEN